MSLFWVCCFGCFSCFSFGFVCSNLSDLCKVEQWVVLGTDQEEGFDQFSDKQDGMINQV